MGLFNYKDYHQAQITGLISASYNIAVYANTGKVLGLGSFLVSRLFAKHPDRIDYSTDVLNEGWRDITVEELRLSSEYVDSRGFYRFPSPVTGNPASGFGPQLKVVGLFDAQQNLQKIAISFCGTNDICDIVDYTQLNNGKALSEAENLLQSIRDFAISNGLSGEDVIVTGYSLVDLSLYIDLCNCLILICSIQHQMKVNLWTKNSYRLWLTNWPKTSKPLKTSVSLIGC
ncbi:hypothetical protein ACVFBI_005264 [Escherichia coli]